MNCVEFTSQRPFTPMDQLTSIHFKSGFDRRHLAAATVNYATQLQRGEYNNDNGDTWLVERPGREAKGVVGCHSLGVAGVDSNTTSAATATNAHFSILLSYFICIQEKESD